MKFLSLIFILALGVTFCTSQQKKSEKKQGWSESMQGLSGEVKQILPFVYSRQINYSKKEVKSIQNDLENFAKTAHKIAPQMGEAYLGDDPMVRFSLDQMTSDVQRASHAVSAGQIKYAKGVMKTVMGHCFRCHSMTTAGSQAKWEVSNFSGLSLNPLEKAELLVATRKYEEATHLLEKALVDDQFMLNLPFDYEAALRRYLVITVRLKPNPQRAIETFEKVLEKKNLPYYLSRKIDQWRAALREWSRSSSKNQFSLSEARRLLKKAQTKQSFSKDQAADVEYLRATEVLHQLLLSKRTSDEKANIYYLLGEVYEVLDELGYWSLHETYYESCISEKPHSHLSSQCFHRLQESIYLGYSGSSGVHVPSDELERLKQLRAKALPEQK
ncbi:MAG: hypothetical protein KDD34_03950 [Bdellovibrionales bacterium]|nr:hypothetical protein [Bdellovibrionales bacterium]